MYFTKIFIFIIQNNFLLYILIFSLNTIKCIFCNVFIFLFFLWLNLPEICQFYWKKLFLVLAINATKDRFIFSYFMFPLFFTFLFIIFFLQLLIFWSSISQFLKGMFSSVLKILFLKKHLMLWTYHIKQLWLYLTRFCWIMFSLLLFSSFFNSVITHVAISKCPRN